MSLFPAYGPLDSASSVADDGVIKCPAIPPISTLDPLEEAEILKSDSSSDVALSQMQKEKVLSSDRHKKKKKKHSKSDVKKYSNLSNEDFYLEAKRDYGNLRVSTLYIPARPLYTHKRAMIGDFKPKYAKKRKQKSDRYYNMVLKDHEENDDAHKSQSKKKQKKKNTNDFIVISDSGIQWDDDRIEKELVEKTTNFNKYLNNNPYDVDMWLQYVKFQENHMVFDVFNKRVTTLASARNFCYSKQLSILDAALKHNFNSIKLLCKKIKISEKSMPNDQYLAMLKQLVSTPDLQSGLLNRAWFWYLDAVQYSMALFSVPSIKEMFAGAIKALSKVQKTNYQKSHVDITYRLGLFLRQGGLWEQLWMLIKMNIETNLALSKDTSSLNVESLVSKVNLSLLMAEEIKIISSGLPMHEIWARVELIRSKVQWLPSNVDTENDPQRIVFSTDLADFIKPISIKPNMFALTVNMIRLLKIPLLPVSNNMITDSIDWEHDGVESFLPFLYEEINGFNLVDPVKIQYFNKIMRDFVDHPNYFDCSGDYFKFANQLMLEFSRWFEGDKKTAIISWWLRWIRTITALHSLDDLGSVKDNIRKMAKNVLKLNREDAIIYKEFSLLEAQLTKPEKGLAVLESCLRALPPTRSISRIHLARSYVEMVLRNNSESIDGINKCKNVLIALAKETALPQELSVCNEDFDIALNHFADETDTYLLGISNFDREIELVEHLVPDIISDWICCHGWFIYLTQPDEVMIQFHKKITAATFVEKVEKMDFDSKRLLKVREEFLKWYISISYLKNCKPNGVTSEHFNSHERLVESALKEYPLNSSIVWSSIDVYKKGLMNRCKLDNFIKDNEETSQNLALALMLQNFINLYKKYDPVYKDLWQLGHTNRLLKLLQTIICHPALKKCTLIWRMLIEFVAYHTQQSPEMTKQYLYQALDECPWNKALYYSGCVRIPSEFSALIDIMVEKQIRLHAMPEELSM